MVRFVVCLWRGEILSIRNKNNHTTTTLSIVILLDPVTFLSRLLSTRCTSLHWHHLTPGVNQLQSTNCSKLKSFGSLISQVRVNNVFSAFPARTRHIEACWVTDRECLFPIIDNKYYLKIDKCWLGYLVQT